jgi:hypothetical protein
MLSKIRWLRQVALSFILWAICLWWTGHHWQGTKPNVLNAGIVIALVCVGEYVPRCLSWRIACFAVLAVVFALDVFSPAVGSPMASLITGLALGLILPVMTMWEAWNDLRGSEGRQREKAKAIIAGHIRTSSRGSLPDSPLVF